MAGIPLPSGVVCPFPALPYPCLLLCFYLTGTERGRPGEPLVHSPPAHSGEGCSTPRIQSRSPTWVDRTQPLEPLLPPRVLFGGKLELEAELGLEPWTLSGVGCGCLESLSQMPTPVLCFQAWGGKSLPPGARGCPLCSSKLPACPDFAKLAPP